MKAVVFDYFKSFFIGIIAFSLVSSSVKAEDNSTTNTSNLITEFEFVPPKDGKKPNTKGAGTRNPDTLKCNPEDNEISALMPEDNFGLTAQKHPEIFIDLPKTSAKQVVLSFESQDKEYHQIAFLPIDPVREGEDIASFSLPEDKAPLENDVYYQWKLTLVCGNIPHVDDPILSGWIQRKELETNNFNNQTAKEQAQWYARNGYWYEFLSYIKQAKTSTTEQKSWSSKLWQELIKKY